MAVAFFSNFTLYCALHAGTDCTGEAKFARYARHKFFSFEGNEIAKFVSFFRIAQSFLGVLPRGGSFILKNLANVEPWVRYPVGV